MTYCIVSGRHTAGIVVKPCNRPAVGAHRLG